MTVSLGGAGPSGASEDAADPVVGETDARHDGRTATDLELYTRTAEDSAAMVIRRYSTSFGAAVRLLAPEYRTGITSVYALVRVADELVDGAAEQAGLLLEAQRSALDELETETEHAMSCGFSANLVVHAFARTAKRAGIGRDLTAPFFASMRADLGSTRYTSAELDEYVYGSAEVVGLMCLRVFLAETPTGERPDAATCARLAYGARRLGSAFQKVNFLRDLGSDVGDRGRDYFGEVAGGVLPDELKHALIEEIDDDLRAAARVIPDLPAGCRTAVGVAHDLFAALGRRIDRTPADELMRTRVRVPDVQKLAILLRAISTRPGRGSASWRPTAKVAP
ncbi:squalene/phytoene synthase family protein [Planctomonas sp. JC2975]|uniref:phytoene/squalene synthase family protein n=1 Tax=Planctomonas sp. JC2975 TaxID=2729626 RepID=UPI001474C854|nr:squalene/phytoene synthase family protein [Planctomonas sp. JC2975]NNC12688.1 squalene/phytoene synthase family protein [Planctomonas sp. JC2975]